MKTEPQKKAQGAQDYRQPSLSVQTVTNETGFAVSGNISRMETWTGWEENNE